MGPETMHPLAGYEGYNCRDWDGYGAEPITPQTLDAAKQMIDLLPDTLGWPDIAPGGDGSIGLEWVPAGKTPKMFFDIGPGERWRAYWRCANGSTDRQEGLVSDSTTDEMRALFERIANGEVGI